MNHKHVKTSERYVGFTVRWVYI